MHKQNKLKKMIGGVMLGALLFQSTVVTAEPARTREQVAEGLIAAEGCLAMTTVLIILARNPAIVEKVAATGLKADAKIEMLVASLGIGESTAALLVRAMELGLVARGTGALIDAYFKMCKRGGEEIVEAFKDLPGAAGTVIGGADTTGPQERKLNPNNPIRVARECWDASYRGVFKSKRASAIECCERIFGAGTNDNQACKNNVNTIADTSGW